LSDLEVTELKALAEQVLAINDQEDLVQLKVGRHEGLLAMVRTLVAGVVLAAHVHGGPHLGSEEGTIEGYVLEAFLEALHLLDLGVQRQLNRPLLHAVEGLKLVLKSLLRPTEHRVSRASLGERLKDATRLTEVGLPLEAMAAKAEPAELVLNDVDVREVDEVVMVRPLASIPVLLSEVVMKLLPHGFLCFLLGLNHIGRLLLARAHNEVASLRDPILPRLLLLGTM